MQLGMSVTESITRFKGNLQRDRYSGARYALIAFERDGALHNLRTRVIWHTTNPKIKPFRSAGHRLIIATGWLPWKAALQFVEKVPEGHAQLQEFRVTFQDTANNRPYMLDWERQAVGWSQEHVGWPAHSLVISGLQIGSVLNDTSLDWLRDRLISLRPDRLMSWRDVERLFGLGFKVSSDLGCGVELFAPIYARFLDSPQLASGGKLTVHVESHLNPKTAGLEVVVQRAESGELITAIPSESWSRGRGRHWNIPIDVRLERGVLRATLIAGGLNVGERDIALPSLAARLLEGLDGGPEWLERLLLPKAVSKSDSRGFERAVVSLFALGGIPTVPLGHNGPDRASDIICAIAPNHVILGDCTIGPIAPKKCGDIRHRAQDVISRLRRPGEAIRLTACIFTPLASSAIPAEHKALADQSGTIVIWRERLEDLLRMAKVGTLEPGLIDMLDSWGPSPSIPLPLRRRARR